MDLQSVAAFYGVSTFSRSDRPKSPLEYKFEKYPTCLKPEESESLADIYDSKCSLPTLKEDTYHNFLPGSGHTKTWNEAKSAKRMLHKLYRAETTDETGYSSDDESDSLTSRRYSDKPKMQRKSKGRRNESGQRIASSTAIAAPSTGAKRSGAGSGLTSAPSMQHSPDTVSLNSIDGITFDNIPLGGSHIQHFEPCNKRPGDPIAKGLETMPPPSLGVRRKDRISHTSDISGSLTMVEDDEEH